MKTILRGVLAVVLGLVVGSGVNMGLVILGPHLIPPPDGVDVNNVESIRASIHLFEPRHFLFPFLAHAVGTLAGAAVAFVVTACCRIGFALGIGVVFLAGGIAAANMIPAPTWFIVADLALAYLPMAWLGARIGRRFTGGV